MTRHPDDYRGAGKAVYGDVSDPEPRLGAGRGGRRLLPGPLAGQRRLRDARTPTAARVFGAAAAEAGVERIIYLGGLGRGHRGSVGASEVAPGGGAPARPRRRAGDRAAGRDRDRRTAASPGRSPGSSSITCRRWSRRTGSTTKTQPIALRDVIDYLVGVLEPAEARGRTYEIGGPEVLTYAEMMQRVAADPPRAGPADPGRAAAHPAAVVALAGAGHRRGHRDRPQPGRLDEQRGDRHRPLDQHGRAGPADELRRGGAAGLRRACVPSAGGRCRIDESTWTEAVDRPAELG